MPAQRRPALTGRQRGDESPPAVGALHRSTKAGPDGPATHVHAAHGSCPVWRRSTKAGPDGPATLSDDEDGDNGWYSAQRRPALTGRQRGVADVELGPVGFAQRRPALTGRQRARQFKHPAHERDRSTKAGPDGPATPQALGSGHVDDDHRSTKAGPDGPATPERVPPAAALAELRSTKAGPDGPATHVAEFPPRSGLWWRSTKAGPDGPATLLAVRPAGSAVTRSTKAGPDGPATRE